MLPLWSIKDARGTTRPVGLAGWRALARADQLRLLRTTLSVLVTLGLGAMVISLTARSWRVGSRAEPYRSISLIGLSTMTIFALRGWFIQSRALGTRVAAARLRLHCCPTCNYPLDGIEPDNRNGRTCPECSATWELPLPMPQYHGPT
jgi:hypothetical protein